MQLPLVRAGAGNATALVAAVSAAPVVTTKGIKDFDMVLFSGSL